MTGAAEQPGRERGAAPWQLRAAALVTDCALAAAIMLLGFWGLDDAVACDLLSWTHLAAGMYLILVTARLYRFVSVLFSGTTLGLTLTDLRIASDFHGRPVGKSDIALRELLALLFFATPIINVVWIVPTLIDSSKPTWYERVSGTAIVRKISSRRALTKAGELPDTEREAVPLGLRTTALVTDCLGVLVGMLIWFWTLDHTLACDLLAGTDFRHLPVGVYFIVVTTLLYRLTWGLLSWTTAGRTLTGLWIVSDFHGGPVGRSDVALREFLALLLFALPVVNVVWIALILLDSKRFGWHEWISGTTVVRAS